jgi:hypothetical protein
MGVTQQSITTLDPMPDVRLGAQFPGQFDYAQSGLRGCGDHPRQTMTPFGMHRRTLCRQKCLYDLKCMHGLFLSFAVWSLRTKGLTQPCMRRFWDIKLTGPDLVYKKI